MINQIVTKKAKKIFNGKVMYRSVIRKNFIVICTVVFKGKAILARNGSDTVVFVKAIINDAYYPSGQYISLTDLGFAGYKQDDNVMLFDSLDKAVKFGESNDLQVSVIY